MPKVILVRHGESESNKIIHINKTLTEDHEEQLSRFSNPNLTDLGFKQATQTGNYLHNILKNNNKKINVWISPYDRTQQTAKPFLDICLSQSMQLETNIVPDLYEYTSPKKQLGENLLKLGVGHDHSFDDFVKRVIQFNSKLKEKLFEMDEDQILIIFGHSLFFSILMEYQVVQESYSNIHDVTFELPNCSISTIGFNFEKNKWSIYNVATMSHLQSDYVTGTHTSIGLRL